MTITNSDRKHLNELINEELLNPERAHTREQLIGQGVNAAPALTVAYALLITYGIPHEQAIGDVLFAHEEFLKKFIEKSKKF